MLALKALGIHAGDEVIVSSNTFIATALAVTYTGATPVFVEPDIRTFNIDPTKIEEKITKKTKAIMPVHLYGQPCDMAPIMEIAKKYHLHVVEDCAQAHTASSKPVRQRTNQPIIPPHHTHPEERIWAGQTPRVPDAPRIKHDKIKQFYMIDMGRKM